MMTPHLKIIARITLAVIVLSDTISCSNTTVYSNPPSASATNKQYTGHYNQHMVDTAVSMLHMGDIVLRMGIGADSHMLAMLNRKNKTYSHCGIVMIENDYPFVYHSIGGEDNPDARLRRDSACFFFSPLHNTQIAVVRYNFDTSTVTRLKETVSTFYKKKPRFDMKFDLATDDDLYCSEFVYKAVNKATDDSAYISTSLLSGSRFVGIDDLFINPHAQVIWQTKFKQYLYTQK